MHALFFLRMRAEICTTILARQTAQFAESSSPLAFGYQIKTSKPTSTSTFGSLTNTPGRKRRRLCTTHHTMPIQLHRPPVQRLEERDEDQGRNVKELHGMHRGIRIHPGAWQSHTKVEHHPQPPIRLQNPNCDATCSRSKRRRVSAHAARKS